MKFLRGEPLIAVNLYYEDDDGGVKIFTLYKKDEDWHVLPTYLRKLPNSDHPIPYALPYNFAPSAKMKRLANKELDRLG